jgi:hypothetical protein
MPAMNMARSGKRYTHEEWMALSSDQQDLILKREGPGYTDEAWKRHQGNRVVR